MANEIPSPPSVMLGLLAVCLALPPALTTHVSSKDETGEVGVQSLGAGREPQLLGYMPWTVDTLTQLCLLDTNQTTC